MCSSDLAGLFVSGSILFLITIVLGFFMPAVRAIDTGFNDY